MTARRLPRLRFFGPASSALKTTALRRCQAKGERNRVNFHLMQRPKVGQTRQAKDKTSPLERQLDADLRGEGDADGRARAEEIAERPHGNPVGITHYV